MDILDGRRAVPGDMVECIRNKTVWFCQDGTPESYGPKYGERCKVKEIGSFKGEKYLGFYEYLPENNPDNNPDNNDRREMFIAESFRIVPEDKKADTEIVFKVSECV